MGGLLSSMFNPDLPSDVVVDFDKIEKPSNPEQSHLYQTGGEVLTQADRVFLVVDQYKGCGALIRQAMQSPSDENAQLQMFEGMFPNVERVKAFYTLTKAMNDLAGKCVVNIIESQELNPALLKTLALVFNMALKLDRSKMMHPDIQNDFSQYRRALGKNPRHPGVPVNDIEANNISMFIAQAMPIISELSSTMDNLQRQGKDICKFLADFAHLCCAFVMRERSHDPVHAIMALTAMTVSFLLYDNVNPGVGVFGKGSLIDVKTCVGQIRVLSDVESRGILCDALHYSTRSYEKAPDNVKRIIEAR